MNVSGQEVPVGILDSKHLRHNFLYAFAVAVRLPKIQLLYVQRGNWGLINLLLTIYKERISELYSASRGVDICRKICTKNLPTPYISATDRDSPVK